MRNPVNPVQLNPTAQQVLERSDGQRSAAQVAALLAQEYDVSQEEALADVLALYDELAGQEIVERADVRPEEPKTTMTQMPPAPPRYVRNPDVVLRKEDEDGGLLFNPDTNQVKVVNSSDPFIWQRCDGAHSVAQIVDAICAAFEDVPAAKVEGDVRAYIEGLVESGFVGTLEPLDGSRGG